MRSLDSILRSPAAVFATGSYLAVGLNLIQGVIFMRLIGVDDYGIWLGLLLLFRYGQHCHLGTLQSVQRQLPLMKGGGDLAAGQRYAEAGHGMLTLASVGWGVLGMILVLLFYPSVKLGGAVLVLVTGMEMWWQEAIAELKSQHRFGIVATSIGGRAALNLALLPMVWWWGLDGAYLRWILLMTLVLAWTWARNPVRGRPRFDRQVFGQILRDGGPILAIGVVFSFQVALDQTLIFFGLGEDALGRYGVAALLMTIMLVIPSAIGQTSYPRMLEEYGRDGNAAALFPSVRRRTLLVVAGSAVMALIGAVLMRPVVEWLLPSYLPGVPAAMWLLPGGVFLAASVPSTYYLQTIQKQGAHLRLSVVALAVQLAMGLGALRSGGGIEAIAASTTAAFGVYAILIIGGATRHARGSR
jgi:O-antigen/teichoic acid export membrane protein